MLDFNDDAFIENPYPALAELRKIGKPVWHEGAQMFLAATYADANAVLRNRSLGRIFKAREPESDWNTFNWLHSDSLLDSEPPKHTRLRSLLVKAFNKNKIDSLRPDVVRLTESLLQGIQVKIESEGEFDVIADFAEPLPVKVIAALLGFPDEDEHLLRPWSQAIVKMYELDPSEQTQAEAQRILEEYKAALASAREEAAAIRTQAQADRTAIVEEARNEARTAAAAVTAAAEAQIVAERNQATSALTRQVGELAVGLAGKVVGQSLEDDARVRATVDAFITDLEQQAAR